MISIVNAEMLISGALIEGSISIEVGKITRIGRTHNPVVYVIDARRNLCSPD